MHPARWRRAGPEPRAAARHRRASDDLRPGDSSLNYRRSFPIDKITIDRSVVQRRATCRDDHVIVQAIRDMGHRHGMSITAEGAETEEPAACLRATGCEELQGYRFSRPEPVAGLQVALPRPAARHGLAARRPT